MDYKKYLQKHTKVQLGDIVKKYKLHTKIVYISKKKKEDVINEIMQHTELKKTGIYLKESLVIEPEKKKHTKLINEQEREIVQRMGRARGYIDKLEEELNHLKYEDTYFIVGREGMHPRKNKDEDKIKDTEEQIKKHKEDLKKAFEDYRKFKLF